MKYPVLVVLLLVLFGATSAPAQINMPPPGSPGSSPDTAIRLNATSELMVDSMIRRWMRANYRGWSYSSPEMMEVGDRRYAVVTASSAGQGSRRVYFYVTSRVGADPDEW